MENRTISKERKKEIFAFPQKHWHFQVTLLESGTSAGASTSAALHGLVLVWLREPRGAAGVVFAGLCVSLGNLETLAALEKLFCKMHVDNVGHSPVTKGQNRRVCAPCKILSKWLGQRGLYHLSVLVVL